jgi:DNA-directed RNA polymerase alpha subunit
MKLSEYHDEELIAELERRRVEHLSMAEAIRFALESNKPIPGAPAKEILEMSIDELKDHGFLNTRIHHRAESRDILTCAALVQVTKKNLLLWRDMGKVTVDRTERRLKRVGLRFGMSPEEVAELLEDTQ